MLILSRHKDEALRIGDNVRILVVDIRDGKVRLGIDAPRALAVHREEVYGEIIEGGNAESLVPPDRKLLMDLLSLCVTCKVHSSREWIELLVSRINSTCEAIGEPRRFGVGHGGDIELTDGPPLTMAVEKAEAANG